MSPGPTKANPPQTIISLPVHTALAPDRLAGALMVLVATQLLVLGLYLPPDVSLPLPQIIISLPVHTAAWESRALGACAVLVAVQLFVPGLYMPPVFKS